MEGKRRLFIPGQTDIRKVHGEEVPFNKDDMSGIHFPHRRRHLFKESIQQPFLFRH